MKGLRIILVGFAVMIVHTVTAQNRQLYWIRYFNQVYFNTKLSWQTELEERRFINPDEQRQFIAHTYVNFQRSLKNEYTAGISGSWVDNAKGLAVPEFRFFQSIAHRINIYKKVTLQGRFRLEERFFRNVATDGASLAAGTNFKIRTRYRLQLQTPIGKSGRWVGRLNDEVMYHTDSNSTWKFDQNRIYVSAEYIFDSAFSIEAGYLFHTSNSSGKITNTNNLRVTFYHKLGKGRTRQASINN